MNLYTKKSIPASWVMLFTIIATLCLGVVFAINYIVDPFGAREWIVSKHYKPIVHERSEKYNLIFNQHAINKYDCVILGSSRVMSMVPSANNATKSCYNFGVHTANNPEKLFILQEWLKHGKLKKVYLGNELYNMHSQMQPLGFSHYRFTRGSEGNHLSYSTLKISFKTLKNSLSNQPQTYFKDDGSIYYFQDEQAIKNNTFDHTIRHFQHTSKEAIEGNFIQNPLTYEPKALEPLRHIKALCDQHHIQLNTFITPTFYDAQTQMRAHPNLANATQRFHNDLVSIFGTVYDFDINHTENKNPVNFYDPVHYRPHIGNLMIDRMNSNGTYGAILVQP